MIKHFCDNCGNLINAENRASIDNTTTEVADFQIRIRVDPLDDLPPGMAEERDLCIFCAFDAIAKLNTRPKVADKR